MKSLYKEIGHRITMLRYDRDITQAKLAELLDISVKHCSEVERGLSGLSVEKLVTLCDILSTNLEYLIRGIDNRSDELSNVPHYIVEMFNNNDEKQKELLNRYFNMYLEIRNN